MVRNITNIAASVHQRLLNKAKESSRPFNELLLHFAIERFIYRLSRSPYADRFILKGALMLSVWSGPGSRSTKDIDFLGRIENRNSPIPIAPAVFDPSFMRDGDKKIQWQGFLGKARLADAPKAFEDVVAAIKIFFEPLVASLAERRTFRSIWYVPGPWR